MDDVSQPLVVHDDEYKGFRVWHMRQQLRTGPKVWHRVIEVIADTKRRVEDFPTAEAARECIDRLVMARERSGPFALSDD